MRFAAGSARGAHLVDGSGLARGNRAAPRAVVRLLRGMYRHRGFEPYYESLAARERARDARGPEHEPPLPREDGHDQRRERPVGLLPRAPPAT